MIAPTDYDCDYEVNRLGSAQILVHILFAKCPVILGLLQIDYAKLFLNDPFAVFKTPARPDARGVSFQTLEQPEAPGHHENVDK